MEDKKQAIIFCVIAFAINIFYYSSLRKKNHSNQQIEIWRQIDLNYIIKLLLLCFVRACVCV